MLRIMLETLFLDDSNRGELAYQLALRISKLYGTSIENKKDIFNKIKRLYNWSSEAVHNGKINLNEKKETQCREYSKFAIQCIKRKIKDLINGNEVDWEEILMN